VDGVGQRAAARFIDEQANVLRHHDVSIDTKIEAATHALQAQNEEIKNTGAGKTWVAAITTEGYKVGLSGFLESPETARHEVNLHGGGLEVKYHPG
jgi:hypothetical protein